MGDLYPTISQITFWGVGDIDECSILATYWAARAAGFQGTLPSIAEFRRAAGRPDRPGPTGLTNAQVWKGVRGTALAGTSVNVLRAGTAWVEFASTMRMGGFASIAVDSSKLPFNVRFNFFGAHRVGVTWSNGQWYIANPLAPSGSAPRVISEAAIRRATLAFGGGSVSGIVFAATGETATGTTATPVPASVPLPAGLPAFVTQYTDAQKMAEFYGARRHRRV